MTFNTPLPIVSRIGVYMELISMVHAVPLSEDDPEGVEVEEVPSFLTAQELAVLKGRFI